MKTFEIKISDIEDSLKNLDMREFDSVYVAQIVQFNCVKLCGVLEKNIKEHIASEFMKNNDLRLNTYISYILERYSRNPSSKEIIEIYSNIDKKWIDNIKIFWSDGIKDHIDTVVNNRNRISHGIDVDISKQQLLGYASSINKFCSYIWDLK